MIPLRIGGLLCRNLPFVVLLLMVIPVAAQPSNKFVTDATMAAPNAAALGKYGDIPVNMFTGIPDINIPLHNIQEGPLSLPVTLNYHSSGTKVAEMASWVGMGWSLNAGGIITRTVQGIPDESFPYGYYAYGPNLPATFDLNNSTHRDLLKQAGQGGLDTEPDLFTFNVGGYSGKFYIDHSAAVSQGKPAYTFIPRQDLKLEFNSTFTKFTIIGTDGTRYTFGEAVINGSTVTAREYTHQYGEPNTKTYCSSWYLLKVESADLKYSISLSYAQEYYAYWNYAPCKRLEFSIAYCPDPQGGQGGTNVCNPTGIDTYHPAFITEIDGKRLSGITSSTETIDFVATTNRLDLDPDNLHTLDAKRLEYVDIKSGSPQVACKRFTFTYDYFTDTTTNLTTSLYKRLRLKTLQESTCAGTTLTIPQYVFTYNGNFLPWRLSKAVDHWGFYNGALGNETQYISVPATTLTVPNSNTTVTYGSANRESNNTWMQKGMLTEIKYPTGGKTKFLYEANVVLTPVATTLQKLQLYSCPAYIGNCCGSKTNTSANIQFTAAELANNNTKFKIGLSDIPSYLSPPAPSQCVNNPTVTCTVQAFRSSDNAAVGNVYSFNVSGNPENQTSWTGDINLSYLEGYLTFQPNTDYKFTISTTDGYGQLYINSTTVSDQNKVVGGLRIKEVRNHDGISSANDVVKTYEYLDEGSATQSSGVLYQTPVYGHNLEGVAYVNDPFQTDGPSSAPYYQMMFTEQSLVPMFNFDGYHCGYKRVKENHNGNGYKVYNFLYQQTNPPVYTYPRAPDQPTVTLGKPSQERTYDSGNNLKASTTLQGTAYGIQTNTGSLHKVLTIPFTCTVTILGQQHVVAYTAFRAVKYILLTAVYRVDSKTDLLDGVSTATNYEYGNFNQYFMPTAEVMTNSDGKSIRVEYKYPYDLAAGCLRDQLLLRNIIRDPYETIKKVGTLQVGGTRKVFAAFNDNGTFYSASSCLSTTHARPYQYYNYEMTWNSGVPTTGSWVLKGTMNSYDAKGKPASFTAANWTDPETYVWATGGQILSKTYKLHTISYDYYPGTRMLRSITDIDGRKTGFTYDYLMRLTKSTKDNASVSGGVVVDGNVKTEYVYHYLEPAPADQTNWVKTKNTYTAVSGSNLTTTETFEYVDGLGRPLQTVKKGWSPAQKDVAFAVAYDIQGRVSRKYTPFEVNASTGALATIPGSQTNTLFQYEPSPLNRLSSVTPPGWYATSFTYGANVASEVGYYDGSTSTSYYPANSLIKETSTTPQSLTKNLQNITYKDKKGRVVLTQRKEAGSTLNVASTYHLYDDKDRISKVLPPGVSALVSETNLRFEYGYDGADHMTYKKIPDMDAINMKYNLRDQLVLVQDGNMLPLNKWKLNKYDDYGRLVSNGSYVGTSPDPNTSGSLTYNEQYTGATYSLTADYTLGKLIQTQTWIPGFTTPITRTLGYSNITGRLVTDNGNNHLNNSTGSDNYTFTYDYAGNKLTDVRAHKTSTASSTLTLTTRSTYDHSGRKTALYHQINANTEKQLAQYVYDFRDRLTDRKLGAVSSGGTNSFLQSVDYAYNDQDWLTSINGASSFSALSQSAIALCATNPAIPNPAEAAFAADPDGNDVYKLDLYYDSPGLTFGSPTGQRNGNISQVVWQTRGRERQGYSLQYDYLNRLTSSYYADISSTGTFSTDNKFQEDIAYADARGNIQSIVRKGLYKDPSGSTCYTNGVIDNLSFTYNYASNRIQKVTELATGSVAKYEGFNPGVYATGSSTYLYDANGNMKADPYKGASTGMSVSYNYLNQPTTISFGSNGSTTVLYDNSGKKLRKTVTPTTSAGYTQDYLDGLEYRTNSGGGALTLEGIYHDEGRITPAGANYQYEYTIKDHLGDSRISFADLNANNIVDVPGDILQENHYYPFGMNMKYGWMDNAALDNRYQYNGKEYNDDFALNWNDYGARWYDPAVGRWWTVDPMSEKYFRWSPYNYAACNPMLFIDPNGMDLIFNFINKKTKNEDRDQLQSIINKGLEGAATVEISKKGKVTLSALKEGASDKAKALYNTINKANTAEKDVKIKVTNSTDAFVVGSTKDENGKVQKNGTIDVADLNAVDKMINKTGLPNAETSQSKLAHEVEENYQIQAKGEKDWQAAHNEAIKAENSVSGTVRDSDPAHEVDLSGPSGRSRRYQTNFTVDGSPVIVDYFKHYDKNDKPTLLVTQFKKPK